MLSSTSVSTSITTPIEDRFKNADGCALVRNRFSSYLDGALDGRKMAHLAKHLTACDACRTEFQAWRAMQSALGDLGPVMAPEALQAQLRDTLAGELQKGTHRSPARRLQAFWRATLMPVGLRLSAGLAGALLLASSLTWVVGTAAPVQANDDRLAHFNAPVFLYSMTSPAPITTSGHFVAVLVDAKINAQGRVYDYQMLEGPTDAVTRSRVEANLLGSIFKPATVFGVPVPGHAVMTYTAVSVRG